jgi:predicted DNA-binding WGR domain protein
MNLVAHYLGGNSDKVYVVGIVPTLDGRYSVVARWGRRGGTMKQTPKGEFNDLIVAKQAAKKVFRKELDKGYEDINSPSYFKPLRMDDPWLLKNLFEPIHGELEPNPSDLGLPASFFQKPKQAPAVSWPNEKEKEWELICLDATGMTDGFDEGVEYLVMEHAESALVWVYDRNGTKVERFRARFGTMEEYRKRARAVESSKTR